MGRTQRIEVIDHHLREPEDIVIPATSGGHGGGDTGLMETFIDAIHTGGPVPTSPSVSLESHHLAFAAEHARVTGEVVDMQAWRSGVGR